MNNSKTKEFIPIGRIANTHGVHGTLRLAYYNEDKARFFSYRRVILRDAAGHQEAREVMESRIHGKVILVRFKNADNLEQAGRLVGSTVLVKRADLPELEAGEYYWADLIGLRVGTMEGDYIGTISEIMATGGTDVFVIRTGSRELLVPADEDRIQRVDLASGWMTIRSLEGLRGDDAI